MVEVPGQLIQDFKGSLRDFIIYNHTVYFTVHQLEFEYTLQYIYELGFKYTLQYISGI